MKEKRNAMSEFKVKPQVLRNAAVEEEEIQKQIYHIYDEILAQKNSISFQIGATRNIKWRLNRVADGIGKEYKTLQSMQKNLSKAADRYEKTENTICNVAEDGKATNWEKITNYDWTKGLPKTMGKMILDIISQVGTIGGASSALTTLLKILMDGDGFSAKDIGAMLKGTGTSLIKIIESIKHFKNGEIDKLWGLNECKTIITDSQAGWLNRAATTFGDTFLDKLNIFKTNNQTGATSIDGAKVGGWALSLIANGFSNYEEYQKGGITEGRAVAETVVETGIDIAKGAAIAAGVAAGAAALGVAAPAVVVAGAGVVVSAGLDFFCKKITGAVLGEEKSLTETISDGILDLAENAMEGLSGAWSSAKEAMCSWRVSFGYA